MENRLNGQRPLGRCRFELINFSKPMHRLLQYVDDMSRRVMKLNPDMVIWTASVGENFRVAESLARPIELGAKLLYPKLIQLKRKLKLKRNMGRGELISRLMPFYREILHWSYRKMSRQCRGKCKSVVMYLPPLNTRVFKNEVVFLNKTATQFGIAFLDISNAYGQKNHRTLQVSLDDPTHPNKEGHALIAKEIYPRLVRLLKKHRPARCD